MKKILAEAFRELFWTAVSQANAVIRASVVDETIETAMVFLHKLDGFAALFGVSQMGFDEIAFVFSGFHLGLEPLHVVGEPTNDDNFGAFIEASARDSFTNTCAASCYNNDSIRQTKIHNFSVRMMIRALIKCEQELSEAIVLSKLFRWSTRTPRAIGEAFRCCSRVRTAVNNVLDRF
jgi:hypothetical protein